MGVPNRKLRLIGWPAGLRVRVIGNWGGGNAPAATDVGCLGSVIAVQRNRIQVKLDNGRVVAAPTATLARVSRMLRVTEFARLLRENSPHTPRIIVAAGVRKERDGDAWVSCGDPRGDEVFVI